MDRNTPPLPCNKNKFTTVRLSANPTERALYLKSNKPLVENSTNLSGNLAIAHPESIDSTLVGKV
ncbi:hypothetical protein C3Y92_02370 [Solidesulfovibrio carbinolicus]|uniref:Uncharacterized protein n=1 Tax=Solidesulfovibrio carbinolicus TaxID=296842 RepID=A0A4P6HI16_9BACT|nr:hypothetical protein C3Y92_02370 [Solidesulfovibrio carbinolicus]